MAAQDMPPPGGFASINVERTFARPLLRQGILFAAAVGLTLNGLIYIKEFKLRSRVLKIEQTEHFIATMPFILVEQERLFLKHLNVLQEEERTLMKDHPGWKPATLYGQPIYKTLPKNTLPPIQVSDYIVHRSEQEFEDRCHIPDQHL